MTNSQSNITDAPDRSSPVGKPTTTPDPAPSSPQKSRSRRRPEDPESIIVTLLSDVRHTEDKLLEWTMRAAASFAWTKRNLPRKEWRRLFKEKRLRIGIRAAQMQCRIGDNAGLRNLFNQLSLPHNIAALYELSALKPDTISRLCEDKLITRKMTTREARALVRKALADEAAGTIRPPTIWR